MTRTPDEIKPPSRAVDVAVDASLRSPCRSKRGVAIFQIDPDRCSILARGYNHKPAGFECDGSAACKSSCRIAAVHAEQHALLRAGLLAQGADLLHVKTVDGMLVASGGPSCVQCSKLALAAQIAGVWLFHVSGWQRYDTATFHRLSVEAAESAHAVTQREREQLRDLAREFVAYWTTDRSPQGCGMCGVSGLRRNGVEAHSSTCYVGRMAALSSPASLSQEEEEKKP